MPRSSLHHVLLPLLLLSAGSAAAESRVPPAADPAARSPAAARQRLIDGNARFVAGRTLVRDWAAERARTTPGQHPFAVVLSCLDSRTASELIFDQGLGEIFNARIAGNVVNDDILGSMEFACQVAGARLIVVVGHSACGAVAGAGAGAELGHLTGLLARIQPAVARVREAYPGASPSGPAFLERVTEENVRLALRQIRARSAVLRGLIDSGAVGLAGAIHDLGTGQVRFLPE